MPSTTAAAFEQLRTQKVDLDPDEVSRARNSRNYLLEQISALPGKDNEFPRLYGSYEYFGSFARKTKVQPLDDIDLLVLLAGGNTRSEYYSGYTYRLCVTASTSPLWPYTDNGYLNSTRVLNKFKSALQSVSYYKQSDIKRTGEAVALNLTSYPWSFDLVPAFPVGPNGNSIEYYLIPDGNGQWKRTDPRRDQTAITDANKRHNNNLVPLIRLMKYWNVQRHAAPRIPSYYLETMLINGLRYQPPANNIRGSIPLAFRQLAMSVMTACPDPKGLGPDLAVGVAWDDRIKVSQAANTCAQFADLALASEVNGDHKSAIASWDGVFPDFPCYG